jgi:WD40 repeat protein
MILKRRRYSTAFALWLAGCAAVWYFLPVRPAAVIPARQAGGLIFFSGDWRTVLTREYGTCNLEVRPSRYNWPDPGDPERFPNGPYHLWDTATGRTRLTWMPPSRGAFVSDLAPDASTAIVYNFAEGRDTAAPFNLTTGRREDWPWWPDGRANFTTNGRYLVANAYSDGRVDTVWFDRQARRVTGAVRDTEWKALATDGTWASISEDQQAARPVTVTIREPVTGRELSRYKRDKPFSELSFSRDGAYLLAADAGGVEVVGVADGRACLRLPQQYSIMVLSNVHQVATIEPEVFDLADSDKAHLVWRDLPSGQIVRRKSLHSAIPPGWKFIGNDPIPECGRWLIRCSIERSITSVEEWLSRMPFLEWLAKKDLRWTLILDARTGEEVARIPTADSLLMSPDGQTLLAEGEDGALEFWNVPPRKPWTWLGVAAAVWALPVVWFARRRVRRL